MSTGGNWKDLLKASGEGNTRLVQYHLRNGIDPNFQHAEYFTCPIFEAIRNGHQDIVKILVEQGKADPGIFEDLTDQSTIEVALESGQFEIVEYLNGLLPEHRRYKFRNILVIEGHHGIGKAICKSLLSKGHRVAFTCPSEEDGDVAIRELKAATSNHKIEYLIAKIECIGSINDLAHSIQQKFSSIDVLVFNPGVQPTIKHVNEDGLESTFFLKYMAPCVLIQRLGPLLEKNGPDARVILISDTMDFHNGHPDILKTPFGTDYHRHSTHFHTELCRLILFLNLSRHFENTPVRVMAVHPNVVTLSSSADDLGCCGSWLMRFFPTYLQNDADKIVAGPVWLAESPEAERSHGKFYDGTQPLVLPASVNDLKVLNDWEQWTVDFLASAKGEK